MFPPTDSFIIFGAGKVGRYVLAMARTLKLKVLAFADNDPTIIGRNIDGIPVESVTEVAARHPDAHWFVALYRILAVMPQLRAHGLLERCVSLDTLRREAVKHSFLPRYPLNGIIDKIITVQQSFTKNRLYLGTVNLIVTEHCTLRCRDCCNLVPYLPQPRSWSLEYLLESLDLFLVGMDFVQELHLIGGDAMLHPDIHAIAGDALSRSSIGEVVIYTNAIVMPTLDAWKPLAGKNVSFHITDYDNDRQHIHDFVAAFNTLDMKTQVQRVNEWCKLTVGTETGNRTSGDVVFGKDKFAYCQTGVCTNINDKKVYRCQMVPFATKLGVFPENKDNYIELHPCNGLPEREELRRLLYRFIFDKPHMAACAYCSGVIPGCSPSIRPGSQL